MAIVKAGRGWGQVTIAKHCYMRVQRTRCNPCKTHLNRNGTCENVCV
jgi:hypothetical protein